MAATVAPKGHVRKRQFQPSINSYFHARDAPSSSAPERARSPMSPPLPEDTQASLLSVGMRVRKSVPEGYKTHKTMGVEELPYPSTAPVRKSESTYQNVPTKELMPFCGLNKIGGWRAQEVPSSSAPATMEGMDDLPALNMSQSTLSSMSGSFAIYETAHAANNRKRTYEEEVEEDLDAYFGDMDAEQAPASAQRPIARMKQQGWKGGQDAGVQRSVNDFEDAVFLAPQDGMDVDGG